MMTRTVVVLLIVCAMLVADCDCWRRRRRFVRSATRFAVSGVKSYVATKAVGAAVAAVGKRDALCADLLTPDQVQQLATDLKNTCDDIPVNLATDGLNMEEVKDVFTQSDADGDGKLMNGELTAFSAAIQTTEACAEVEADDKP